MSVCKSASQRLADKNSDKYCQAWGLGVQRKRARLTIQRAANSDGNRRLKQAAQEYVEGTAKLPQNWCKYWKGHTMYSDFRYRSGMGGIIQGLAADIYSKGIDVERKPLGALLGAHSILLQLSRGASVRMMLQQCS